MIKEDVCWQTDGKDGRQAPWGARQRGPQQWAPWVHSRSKWLGAGRCLGSNSSRTSFQQEGVCVAEDAAGSLLNLPATQPPNRELPREQRGVGVVCSAQKESGCFHSPCPCLSSRPWSFSASPWSPGFLTVRRWAQHVHSVCARGMSPVCFVERGSWFWELQSPVQLFLMSAATQSCDLLLVKINSKNIFKTFPDVEKM